MIILFYLAATVAVISTAAVIVISNVVHALIYLILSLLSVAVIFFVLGAPFAAVLEAIVYAGAIMVLFLFVIMLLGAEKLSPGKVLPFQKQLALGLVFVLIIESGYLLLGRASISAVIIPPSEAANSIEAVRELGVALFSDFLLPFEVTSILLLVAMVGAIVLAKREKGEQ